MDKARRVFTRSTIAFLLSIMLFINLLGDMSTSIVQAEAVDIPVISDSVLSSNEVYQLSIQDILDRFQTTEAFIQSQMDQGYSLNEIYNLFYQSEDRQISYEEALLLFNSSEINLSPVVSTEVYNELPSPALRGIPLVPFSSVTGIVYSDPATEEASETVISNVYSNQSSLLRSATLDAPENPKLEKPPVYSKNSFSEAPYSIGSSNESISSISGGLSLLSDDLTLPGRNGLSFTLSRQYNTSDAQFYDMDYGVRTFDYDYYRWAVTYNVRRVPIITKYDVYLREKMVIEYDYNADGVTDDSSGSVLQEPKLDSVYDTEQEARNGVNLIPNRSYLVPMDSVYLTASQTSATNSFPDTVAPQNGYSGVLRKVDPVTVTGSYTPAKSKTATGTRKRTLQGRYDKNGVWKLEVDSGEVPGKIPYSDSEGYTGELIKTANPTIIKDCATNGTPNWICTKDFDANYSGTVWTKASPDTRQYTQKYGGYVDRAAYYSPDRYTAWTSSGSGRVRYKYSRDGAAWVQPRKVEGTNSSIESYVGGTFDEYRDAVAVQTQLNASAGGFLGADSNNGVETARYYVASPAGTSIFTYKAGVGTGYEYYNQTTKPLEEKMYPIGKGWSWNLPFIELKDGKSIVHPGDGGSYTVENGALKGSEWQGISFALDTSVIVNDEKSQYVLTSADGLRKQYFNAEGFLIQIADSNQNTIKFQYVNNATYGTKLLSQIKDAIGNTIEIEYTSQAVTLKQGSRKVVYNKHTEEGIELLDSVTDPIGRKTTYSYKIKNARFNLFSDHTEREASNPYALISQVQHPTGAITKYNFEDQPVKRYLGESSYNESFRLSSRWDLIIYENGTNSEYNRQAMYYNNTDMGSSSNQDFNFSTTLSDGLTETVFNYRKDYIDTETAVRFYLQSSVQSANGLSKTTNYEYGKYVGGRSYPAQSATKVATSNNKNGDVLTTRTSYDDYGNMIEATDAQGRTITSIYDDRHLILSTLEPANEGVLRYTTYTRNSQGQVTSITIRKNNAAGELLQNITFNAFDSYGNILSKTVRNGEKNITTTMEYDSRNHAFPVKQQMDVSDAQGQTRTVSVSGEYDSTNGNLTAATDGEDRRTTYAYDLLGRVTTVTHAADQSNLNAVYDDLLNTITVTDENKAVSQTQWNALGWQVQSGIWEQGAYKKKSSTEYDAFGRKAWTQDALGNKNLYQYDAWNRSTGVQYPDASETIQMYNDELRTITSTTREGYSQIETFNLYGQRIKLEEQEAPGSEIRQLASYTYNQVNGKIAQQTNSNSTTKYAYNDNGLLIAVTDALGETTRYGYDMLGNQLSLTYPDGSSKQKTYNELGEVLTETDEKNQVTIYSYDKAGNLLSQQDRNGVTTNYTYDKRNQLWKKISPDETVEYTYDLVGNRLSMSDKMGTTSYQYDSDTGLLKQITYPDKLKMQILEYDANGNPIEMLGPFGVVSKYAYDPLNRPKSIGANLEQPTISYSYNKNGDLKQVDTDSGLRHTYQYAGLDLTRVNEELAGRSLNVYQYTYDVNKNIQSRIWTQSGEKTISIIDTFGYDDLNQILTSTENQGEAYTYDVRGNRKTLVSGATHESFADRTYVYDKQNRLTQAVVDGEVVDYKYNGDGLLVERTEKGVTSRYYYDGDQIISEAILVNGQPQLVASYLRGNQLAYIRYADGSIVYPAYNGHGDIVEIRNQQGIVLNQYVYDIWGNITKQEEAVHNPFRYSGELWDDTTDLQYLRARWYDPSVGRFLNEDTYEGQMDNPQSQNLYTYVHNNPLIYSDPSGNYCVSSDGNNTHKGFCSSSPQKYEMSDVMIEGMPYINNGVLRGYYRADASIIWLSNNEMSKQSFWQFMTKSQYQEYVEAVPLGNMIVMGGFSSLMSVATAPLYASKPEAKGTGDVKNIFGFDASKTMTATKLRDYAKSQGWTKTQTANGPEKWVDKNGVTRITIKGGTDRAPGSAGPHVEIKDSSGQRIDPMGNPVTRKSEDNHTPIKLK
ncbi:RHS repeat domain-containing protein [Paenibacillus sp. FSL R5-0914]|uniref:RHS repeat domain-containing protein n=1 Tax=Paenibacillus sp. FSL R5-0914 TaxID=2921665 RepID=UPI0030F6A216